MSVLTELSAAEIARRIARRELSAVEVARESLDRLDVYNAAVNAIVTVNPRFLDSARAIDERLAAGAPARPLEGVPFAAKDNLETAGLRTTFGSLVHEHLVPEEDAICVERMLAAGAVLLGKANTPEFATDVNTTNKIFGPTRNPVDLNTSPGGSSGGSAAAVAADFAPLALGTDHGGSIRIPAAWGGLVGLRPSPGRVPVYRKDFGWDTLVAHVQGPIARTVGDLGLALSVLVGPDDRDPSSLPAEQSDYARAASTVEGLAGRRVAFSVDFGGLYPVEPEVEAAIRAAARNFERMGCIVEEGHFDASDLREIIAGTRGFGLVARFADLIETESERMSVQLVGQVGDGLRQSVRAVGDAERRRTAYWHRARAFMEKHEFLLTPTIGAPPFRLDQPLPTTVGGRSVERYYDVFLPCYLVSVTGLPALSVPCGMTREGLPIGLQIVGRRLREDSVLAAGAAYAAQCPQHFTRHPVRLDRPIHPVRGIASPGMRSA